MKFCGICNKEFKGIKYCSNKCAYEAINLRAKKRKMNTQQGQLNKHNCKDRGVFRMTKDYESIVCLSCGYISKFRYKSFIRRIRNLF